MILSFRLLFRPLLVISLLLASTGTIAQPIVLMSEGGTQDLCNATFFDSGFDQSYGPGENFTIAFCPGIPGAVTQAAFNSFDLGAGDQLIVYDGPSTASPILDIGTLSSFAGLVLIATSDCITFEFISDGIGEGTGWEALILCDQPCAEPVGVITPLLADPLKICPTENVAFDASGSSAAAGFSISSYDWDFGDGTTASGITTNHTFSSPGQYTVTMRAVDNIGCVSVNYASAVVQAGTVPDMSGTQFLPASICVGETAEFQGQVIGTQWTNVPEPFVDGLVQLPDGGGVAYSAQVDVSGFPPGTLISSATDLVEICFEMEHSYLGDLEFTLTCPDGQTITLFNTNAGGGGGTYLGGADDTGAGVPGTGALYCFSNVGTFGTMVNEFFAGNFVIAGTPPNNSMTPGSYTSEESFANLIGCNLNGTWTITITDHLFIDDGFIFNWYMVIDPSLYPSLVEFTPTYGADCDSTFWSGPNITAQQPGCDIVTVQPPSSGSYDYTYTVIDDFGCTYDTTLTITVDPAAVINVTSTLPANCGDPVQLNANLIPPIPVGPVAYQWTPAAGLTNASIPAPQASPTVPTWYVAYVVPVGHPMCSDRDSVLVNPLTNLENDSVVVDAICNNDGTGSIQVITTGNGGPWNYTWTDANGMIVQSTLTATGDIYFGSGGTYSVLVSEGLNGNGCQDSLMAFINEPPPVEMTFLSDDTLICRTGTATLLAAAQGGSGLLTYHWNTGALGTPLNLSPTALSNYYAWATDPNNCISDTLYTSVDVNPLLFFDLIDTVVTCPNVNVILAPENIAGGDGAFAFDWGNGFSSDTSLLVNEENSQQFCMTLTDGCETPDITRCVWLDVLPIPELIITADSVLGCDPFFTRFHITDTTGGALAQWNFGDGILIPGPTGTVGHTFSDPGLYDITAVVQWPNGCFDTTTVDNMINVANVPIAEFSWTPNPVSVLAPEVHFMEESDPYAVSFDWDFAGSDTAQGPDPVFVFPNQVGNTYIVQLVVANYLGCTDTVVHPVEVADEFLVFVPNAFTPDGDGTNDQLFVLGDDIDTEEFLLMVFDRWGEKIFETTDRGEGWDGGYNGALVKDGVYAWRLLARSAYTKQGYELTGHVTVLH
ncbi:MAG: PKD domain-containing protein [Flavobacteriales bacterium]|nr:PKD domain-containing protein [Flavobacteriales bacterium]